eukprot:scaffold35853_cov34-Prasinocladus_malaysianus.AAC.1
MSRSTAAGEISEHICFCCLICSRLATKSIFAPTSASAGNSCAGGGAFGSIAAATCHEAGQWQRSEGLRAAWHSRNYTRAVGVLLAAI